MRHLICTVLLALAGPALAEQTSFATMMIPPALEDQRISVMVAPGLTRTAALPTEELRQARRDMLAGATLPDDLLQALADRGDGRAAQDWVRRLLVAQPPASDSDVAWYATIAISTGRVWTLPDAVAAMTRLDPATEPPARTLAYVNMLYPHAWAGNALALDAVIDLNGEGRLFGTLSEATRERILAAAAAAGDGRAFLRLAVRQLQTPAEADMALARDYLTRAMAGDHLAVQTMARTLLAKIDGQGAALVTAAMVDVAAAAPAPDAVAVVMPAAWSGARPQARPAPDGSATLASLQ